jgi:anaerobic magnesium-protoporphyrin IX monomethyl ester cyclase
MQRLFPRLPGIAAYRKRLRAITRNSNALLFQVIDDISLAYTGARRHKWSAPVLRKRCHGFLDEFLEGRNDFVVRNQRILLAALERDAAREPAFAAQ